MVSFEKLYQISRQANQPYSAFSVFLLSLYAAVLVLSTMDLNLAIRQKQENYSTIKEDVSFLFVSLNLILGLWVVLSWMEPSSGTLKKAAVKLNQISATILQFYPWVVFPMATWAILGFAQLHLQDHKGGSIVTDIFFILKGLLFAASWVVSACIAGTKMYFIRDFIPRRDQFASVTLLFFIGYAIYIPSSMTLAFLHSQAEHIGDLGILLGVIKALQAAVEILYLGGFLIFLPFIDRRMEATFGTLSIIIFCFKLSYLSTMDDIEDTLIPFMFTAPFGMGLFGVYLRKCYNSKIFEGAKIKPTNFDIKKILDFKDRGADSSLVIEEFGRISVHLALCKKTNCGCRKLEGELEIFN